MYVTSTGANAIETIAVNAATGALSAPSILYATGGGPVAVAIDPGSRFVYTANQGDNTLSAFSIGGASASNPTLTPIVGSPITVGRTPYGVATDVSGNHLYVANRDDSTISVFSVDAGTGALTAISGSPFALVSRAQLPVSLTMHPSGKFLFVGSAQDITAYSIDSATGAIAVVDPVGAAGSTNVGGLHAAVAVDSTGAYMYVAGSTFVYSYGIDQATGHLQLLANGQTFNNARFNQLTIDPSGKYLLVTDNALNVTHSFRINAADGLLTPVAGSPFALIAGSTMGTGPTDIVAIH
jgi:6-phosphogluconolactonase (cycloisomerase 2 family)